MNNKFAVLIVIIAVLGAWLFRRTFLITQTTSFEQEYDFVIVGAGTAGSVVAHELVTKTNYTVLLVEAGNQFGLSSVIPFLCTVMQGTSVDWGFKTESQKYSSFGLSNQQQKYPRGKGLGGSGQLNYMLHSLGQARDFDNWGTNYGLHFWDYHNFSCHLRDEINCERNMNLKDFHLTDLDIEEMKLGFYLKRSEIELKRSVDKNIKFETAKFAIKEGKRFSSYNSYLLPVLKYSNLHIMMNSMVSKLVINKEKNAKKVIGIEISTGRFVRAKREVILSAGAIQTPQLLKLSGIGSEDELKGFNIPVQVDNGFVGENLFDHLNVPLFVSITKPISVTKSKALSLSELFKYTFLYKGIFSSPAMIGTGTIANSSFGLIIFGVGSVDEANLRAISNYDYETFSKLFPYHFNSSQEGFVLLSTCYHPKSRGTIKLKSPSIHSPPKIDPNFYSDPFDIECTIKGMRLAIKMIETESFQRIGAQIVWPKLKRCLPFDNDIKSDEYLECLIRTVALTGHHQGGTAAMGKVVDERLRVFQVKNLRVIDGSVFPSPISGFPNSPIIALAERASQFIIDDNI